MHIITRYKNRKLYSSQLSRWVTAREIWEMYKEGQEFKVDYYGKDVTHDIVLNSALSLMKKSDKFSQRFLKIAKEII